MSTNDATFTGVGLADSRGVTVGTAKNLVVTHGLDAEGLNLLGAMDAINPVRTVRLAWWQRPEFQQQTGGATSNPAKVKNKARGSTQSRKDKAAHRARVLYAKNTRPAVISETYIGHATAVLDNATRRAWGAGISGSKGLGATGWKFLRLEYRSGA